METETETLTFMPNGDVTLRLVRRVGDQSQSLIKSPLNDSEDAPAEEAGEEEEGADESALFYAPDPPETEHTASVFYPPVRGRRDSGASSIRDRSASPPPGFWARLKKDPVVIIPENQDVACVVSSGHMMLASPYFQKRLSGEYYDAITLKNTGHVTISLDNDPDTLAILLNIIHGRTRQVPRQVNLELLSKLAVLVNYYGMLESVELFSDTWIENLKREGMPTEYNEHVLPWLFIFWVFEKGRDFRDMARLVQRECDETLDELVGIIPLPHTMINAMKNGRQIAIDSAITAIDQLITKYMDSKVNCKHGIDDDQRYACDAMVLGSLMKGARAIGIWPKPAAPFSGKRLGKLLHEIRNIKILDIYNNKATEPGTKSPSWNCHGLEDSIKATMKIIEEGLDDLELDDYKKNCELLWDEFPTSPPTPAFEEAEEIPVDVAKDVEKKPAESPKLPEPTYFVPEEAIEDVLDEFGSQDEVERRFSDEISKDAYPEEVRFGPPQRKSVVEDAKENSPQRNSYVIPRKDVSSKSVEKEADSEEGRGRHAVEQAKFRSNTKPEPPKPRPVVEEIKNSYKIEQSPNRHNFEPQSPEPHFAVEEVKSSYKVGQSPNRNEFKSDSPKPRALVGEIKSSYAVEQASNRGNGQAESPRSRLVSEESTKRASFEQAPYRNTTKSESLKPPLVPQEVRGGHSTDQTLHRNDSNPGSPKSSRPMIEEVQPPPYERESAAKYARGRSILSEVTGSFLAGPVQSPHRQEPTTQFSGRLSDLESMKGGYASDQSQKSLSRREVNAELSRSSPRIEELRGSQEFKKPQSTSYQRDTSTEASRIRSPPTETKDYRPYEPAPSSPYQKEAKPETPRRSPVVEEVKELYPFEQDIREQPVEGAKVTENWRDSSILDVQKSPIQEVKLSPKEDAQVTSSNISNEDNDLFIPPATFKVRKSKKRFATRF